MLYIGLGAVAAAGAYILLKKEDDDNIDLKKGGYHPNVPASTKGGGASWVPDHEGIFRQGGKEGQAYWFPKGPGVACIPGPTTNAICRSPPVYSAGNGALMLTNYSNGQNNGDYIINGTTYWFATLTDEK